MNDDRIPVGFGLALTRNEAAVNAYAVMTRAQKQAVLDQARRARSAQEMDRLVRSLAGQ